MAQLLVRDLESVTVDRLKARARKNRRSLEAEVRVLLETAVSTEDPLALLWKISDQISEDTRARPQTDSAVLVREDRDA
jgi:plasmid stability protein